MDKIGEFFQEFKTACWAMIMTCHTCLKLLSFAYLVTMATKNMYFLIHACSFLCMNIQSLLITSGKQPLGQCFHPLDSGNLAIIAGYQDNQMPFIKILDFLPIVKL